MVCVQHTVRIALIWKAHLDERLDLAPLRQLLRTHTLGDLQWVALNTGNNGMGVGALLGALIELLDHDDLLARLAAGQHDGDLYERAPTKSKVESSALIQKPILFTPFRACILRA